jgi:hypothetical protein
MSYDIRVDIRPYETEISSVLDKDGNLIVLTVEYETSPDGHASYWWRRATPYRKVGPFTWDPDSSVDALDTAFEALDRF